MRLDKYLKVSRLIKRRTVANEACDAGRVLVNGRPARASYDVKVGDVLELKFGEKLIRVEVLSTADIVGKDGADAINMTFINTRDAVSPTGIVMNVAPYALLVVVAAAGCFVFMRKRRED